MMKKDWQFLLFIVALIGMVALGIAAGLFSKYNYPLDVFGNQFASETYTDGETGLGYRLEFPDGWKPILYVSPGSREGRYICERNGEYRVCVPRVDDTPGG